MLKAIWLSCGEGWRTRPSHFHLQLSYLKKLFDISGFFRKIKKATISVAFFYLEKVTIFARVIH